MTNRPETITVQWGERELALALNEEIRSLREVVRL